MSNRHQTKFLFLLLILLAISCTCVAPALAEYTTFHADNARTGAATDPVSLSYGETEISFDDLIKSYSSRSSYPAMPPLITSYPSKSEEGYINISGAGSIHSSPAILDHIVYFGTDNDTSAGIYCVDLLNRTLKWNRTIDSGVMSGITIYTDMLYFGGIDGKLYALEKNNTKLISTDRLDMTSETGLSSTPLVVENTVYVTSQSPAKLWAFSAEDLSPQWNVSLEINDQANISAFSSPAWGNNFIYTSGGPGIVAVSPDSHGIVHQFTSDGPAGTPVFSENQVFFTTATTTYAVSALDLTEQWNKTKKWVESADKHFEYYDTSHGYRDYASATAPAVFDTTVIVNEVSQLAAYSTSDGSQKWTASDEKVTKSQRKSTLYLSPNSPVIAGELVYATFNYFNNNNQPRSDIVAFTLSNGDINDDHTFQANKNYCRITTSSPAVSDGYIVVGTEFHDPGSTKKQNELCNALWVFGFPQVSLKKIELGTEITVSKYYAIDQGAATGERADSVIGALTTANVEFTATKDSGLISLNGITADENGWTLLLTGKDTLPTTWDNLVMSIEDCQTSNKKRPVKISGTCENTIYIFTIDNVIINENIGSVSLEDSYRRAFYDNTPETITVTAQNWKKTDISDQVTWTASGDVNIIGSATGKTITYQPTSKNGGTLTAKLPVDVDESILDKFSITTDKIYLADTYTIPAVTPPDTYLTWKGDNTRAGVIDAVGPTSQSIGAMNSVNFNKEGFKSSALVDGFPVIDGNNIYFTIWDGGMGKTPNANGIYSYSLDLNTENWHSTNITTRSGITIDNGKIYGGSGTGKLACIDQTDGHLVWETEEVISNYNYVALSCTPLVHNGVVYVVTTSGNSEHSISYLYGFDATDGTLKLKVSGMPDDGKSAGVSKFASPSMSPDGVIYAPGSGGVFAYDTKTEQKLWTFDAGAYGGDSPNTVIQSPYTNIGTPVYKDQRIYLVTTGHLYCLNAVTGKEIWHQENGAIASTSAVVTDDLIIVGGTGLTAYDLSGTLKWKTEKQTALGFASPIVAGGIAYYGTFGDETIYAVNIADGKLVWEYKLPKVDGALDQFGNWLSLIEATPVVKDGILYVGAENGVFYALTDISSYEDGTVEIIVPDVITAGVPAIFTTNTTDTTYTWAFNDGSPQRTGKSISKIWDKVGTYTISLLGGSEQKTVTVQSAPAPFNAGTQSPATLDLSSIGSLPAGVTTNDLEKRLGFKFNDADIISGTSPTVTVISYNAINGFLKETNIQLPSNFEKPPNSAKVVFSMEVQPTNLSYQDDASHKLSHYSLLYVNITLMADDKDYADKISFWRYPDGTNSKPEYLKSIAGVWRNGYVEYQIFVPGYSTIIATIDDQVLVPVKAPVTPSDTGGGTGGGGSSGSSYSGLSFTPINPGTGSVSYTTNHPDWPAVTFTFDRMTALGVLLASGKNVVTAERWGGVYVHSINGLSPASDSEGWMYQVNGISPGAMANSYPVQNGDKVVWYYSEDMTKPVSASKQVYAFTVSTSASVSEIAGGSAAQPGQTTKPGTIASTIVPAETKQIQVTIPDGIKVEKLDIGQKITIDTAVTKLTGTVSVNARNLIIIRPGIQITIPLADLIYNGDVATATIRGMTAEIVPVPVTIPKGGYNL